MAKALYSVAFGDTRGFTNALLDLVDEGVLQRDILIGELLRWMSEDEVEEFCTRNLLLRDDDNEPIIRREDGDEDEALLDNFNYVGSRHHY